MAMDCFQKGKIFGRHCPSLTAEEQIQCERNRACEFIKIVLAISSLKSHQRYFNIQLNQQCKIIIPFLCLMYRVIQILRAATDSCRSQSWLAGPLLHGASNCRCSQTLTMFFSHCNTGNFVNIPVHVNKTMPRR